MITGIIPAAGKGSRWGGFLKCMLPCGEGDWLINRQVRAMENGGAERIVIVCNTENISPIASHMAGKHGVPVYYAIQQGGRDIWGAIAEALPLVSNYAFFGMPDTYAPVDVFSKMSGADFEMGLFKTRRPERFGVLRSDRIVNKCNTFSVGTFDAWGVLGWSIDVTRFWMDYDKNVGIETYTQAFNLAIERFGFQSVAIAYYHDMADWQNYRDFVSR